MKTHRLNISVDPVELGVCRLNPSDNLPDWLSQASFRSITWTSEELSIVCAQQDIPQSVVCEMGWRCLKVEGPLDFSMIGVLACLAEPLAQAEISIFALSTYDTDYLLVKEKQLDRAITILLNAGHNIVYNYK